MAIGKLANDFATRLIAGTKMETGIHPISKQIDMENPDYVRILSASVDGSEDRQITIKIWNPVIFKLGVYVSPVSIEIEGLPLTPLGAMPGEDKLDALLKTVAFVGNTLDRLKVVSDWYGKPLGGFPLIRQANHQPRPVG